MPRAIGGAQGVGAPPTAGGTALTGARRVVARPNVTVLGGATGGSGGATGPRLNPRPSIPGQKPY